MVELQIIEVENGYIINDCSHRPPGAMGTQYVAVTDSDLLHVVDKLAKQHRGTD